MRQKNKNQFGGPLSKDVEYALATAWREYGDEAAMHQLVEAYVWFAVSVARNYRRYGIPFSDLVQEAHMALVEAANKFDPAFDVRFSTFAIWQIKSNLQTYVYINSSVVRKSSSAQARKVFFHLGHVRYRLEVEMAMTGERLTELELQRRAALILDAPLSAVQRGWGVVSGSDSSLNVPLQKDGYSTQRIDTIAASTETPEEKIVMDVQREQVRALLTEALQVLTERERSIIVARKISESKVTFQQLSDAMGISREAVRQIEKKALQKLYRHFLQRFGRQAKDVLL